MRSGLRHPYSRHGSRPLVVRGGLGRTFGSLAFFLAVLLLCLGTYILEDAFANPVAAQAVAVITAAFSISLAIVLLFYLLRPARRSRNSAVREDNWAVSPEIATIQATVSPTPEKKKRSDLAPQWVYVDTSQIRPRARFQH